MKIIDTHTHVFPDNVAARAIPLLEQRAEVKAFYDGTLSGLKNSMKNSGVTSSILQPVATSPDQVESINKWIMAIADESIIPFGALHPRYPGWRDELLKLNEHGIKGIKFHADYQEFELDEPVLYEIYEQLREFDMIVLFHMGEDIGLSPPYTSLPEKLKKVVVDFPELSVIASHMGGYKMWGRVFDCLVGSDIYLETSFGIGFMSEQQFMRMVSEHGIDKVVFGSDSPWLSQQGEIAKIRALKLSEQAKQKILFDNAARLMDVS